MPGLLAPLRVARANSYTIEAEVGPVIMATVYLAEIIDHGRQEVTIAS